MQKCVCGGLVVVKTVTERRMQQHRRTRVAGARPAFACRRTTLCMRRLCRLISMSALILSASGGDCADARACKRNPPERETPIGCQSAESAGRGHSPAGLEGAGSRAREIAFHTMAEGRRHESHYHALPPVVVAIRGPLRRKNQRTTI